MLMSHFTVEPGLDKIQNVPRKKVPIWESHPVDNLQLTTKAEEGSASCQKILVKSLL